MTARTPIAGIRRLLQRTENARHMLIGSGRDQDLARQPVVVTLAPLMAALRNQDIPARFADDRRARDRELQLCQETVNRWTALQPATGEQPQANPIPSPAHPVPHIIALGSLSGGFRFIGPFPSRGAADDYVNGDREAAYMTVCELDAPAEG